MAEEVEKEAGAVEELRVIAQLKVSRRSIRLISSITND